LIGLLGLLKRCLLQTRCGTKTEKEGNGGELTQIRSESVMVTMLGLE